MYLKGHFGWEQGGWSMQISDAEVSFIELLALLHYSRPEDAKEGARLILQADFSRGMTAKFGGAESKKIAICSSMLCGTERFITENFPEFCAYRDLMFYWKFSLCTDQKVFDFPRKATGLSATDAKLTWKAEGQTDGTTRITVSGLGKQNIMSRLSDFNDKSYVVPVPRVGRHRFESVATVQHVTGSEDLQTEDDILHCRDMPILCGPMKQHQSLLSAADTELFLSYLTVPYLRMPLLLEFFATAGRMHALAAREVREVLEAIVLEPGKVTPSSHAYRSLSARGE